MKASKFHITTWTSSFRYPNVISGFQPTLEVPPLSTVLGLFNAASGSYSEYNGLSVGYYFKFATKAIDTETIYQIQKISKNNTAPSLNGTSNVIRREFLYDCNLFVYLTDERVVRSLLSPNYQLLLGRSSDLATIHYLGEVEMKQIVNCTKIKGQIIPFMGNFLPGIIQPLPQYFTNTRVRRNIGTQAYSVIPYNSNDFQTYLTAYRDVIDGREVDIYFHKLDFKNECFE